jgi:hypothetical protein
MKIALISGSIFSTGIALWLTLWRLPKSWWRRKEPTYCCFRKDFRPKTRFTCERFFGRGYCMPRYFFSIRSTDSEDHDEDGIELPNDAAALDYACRIVRELKANGGYDDPRMVVQVQNERQQTVLSIPFLVACA